MQALGDHRAHTTRGAGDERRPAGKLSGIIFHLSRLVLNDRATINQNIVLPVKQPPSDLPRPSADALAHSERLGARIRDEIAAAGGAIGFDRFMELALYAPGLGYYSAGARKFGAAGDFITAPELSPLFSQCLAKQADEVLRASSGGDILELGAGSGRMATDMLAELARIGRLPERYLILEVSADLRERQRECLQQRAPELLERVQWLDGLPEAFTGVIVANEVLDALPVQRFRREADGWSEQTVTADGDVFNWGARPAAAELNAALARLETSPPVPMAAGYSSELCLQLPGFIGALADSLERGALLCVDYGYPRNAYYHADRSMGTLMCHYRQRAHDDPFLYPGLQDITAHVDFTAVAEAAVDNDLELAGYTTQAHFLLALGIAERSNDMASAREVKLLTLPDEMGERFKVIGFTKRLDEQLTGFELRDLSHTL
jgi:SAM-dependent MidA family methyltransferase